jgi:hypothetical protein
MGPPYSRAAEDPRENRLQSARSAVVRHAHTSMKTGDLREIKADLSEG